MKEQMRWAIGRIRCGIPGADGTIHEATGTGFVVSDWHVLTCFHVVARRGDAAGASHGFANEITFTADKPGAAPIAASVVPDSFDADADWALLELAEHPPGVAPMPIADPAHLPRGGSERFESYGYPRTVAKGGGKGLSVDGRVMNWDTGFGHGQAVQLHCDQADGDHLAGLSGGPLIIEEVAVGIMRANLVVPAPGMQPQIQFRTLYAWPFDFASLRGKCGSRVPELDFMPGARVAQGSNLPREPFRALHWYEAEHADLFFGRGKEVRQLHEVICGEDAPRLVLVFGAAGVGKSSLLEAGLYPRLQGVWTVRVRRRTTASLVDTFDEELRGAREDAGARKCLVVLDQVEEVFVGDNVKGRAEVRELLRRLKAEFADQASTLRVILSFRHEWLAQMEAATAEAQVAEAKFFVEPLAREQIEEVVVGITRTPRLRERYRMRVQTGLPAEIANWLTNDGSSPVSPMLSITLAELWKAADSQPAREMSLDALSVIRKEKSSIDEFVKQEIDKVGATPEHSRQVASGLVHDLLNAHTSEHASTRELESAEIANRYKHVFSGPHDPRLQMLLQKLQTHSLLTSAISERNGVKSVVMRLGHDTLATPVRKLFNSSQRPGQRAHRRLESATMDGTLLQAGPDTLAVIDEGRFAMRDLEPDELRTISAARTRNRQRLALEVGAVALVLLLTSAGIYLHEAIGRAATTLASRGLAAMEKRPADGIQLLRLARFLEPSEEVDSQILNAHAAAKGMIAVHPDLGGTQDFGGADVTHALSRDGSVAAFVTLGGALAIHKEGEDETSATHERGTLLGSKASIAISSEGACVAYLSPATVGVMGTGQGQCPLEGGASLVVPEGSRVAVATSQRRVFVGTPEGRLVVFHADSPGNLRHEITLDINRGEPAPDDAITKGCPLDKLPAVRTMALSGDEKRLAVGTRTGDIWLVNLEDKGFPRKRLTCSSGPRVNALALNDDGSLIAFAHDNGQPQVWSLADKEIVPSHSPRTFSSVASIALSKDNRYMVIGFWDGNTELWGITDRETRAQYFQHTGGVTHVAIGPGSDRVTSWSTEGHLVQSAALAFPTFALPEKTRLKDLRAGTDGGVQARIVQLATCNSTNPASGMGRECESDDWSVAELKPDAGGQWSRVPITHAASAPSMNALRWPNCVEEADVRSRIAAMLAEGPHFEARAEQVGLDLDPQCSVSSAFLRDSMHVQGVRASVPAWQTYPPSAYGPKSSVFEKHGKWLAIAEDSAVTVWGSRSGQMHARFKGANNIMTKVVVDPSGTRIVAGSDAELYLWPTEEAALAWLAQVKTPLLDEAKYGVALQNTTMAKVVRAWLSFKAWWTGEPLPFVRPDAVTAAGTAR